MDGALGFYNLEVDKMYKGKTLDDIYNAIVYPNYELLNQEIEP